MRQSGLKARQRRARLKSEPVILGGRRIWLAYAYVFRSRSYCEYLLLLNASLL
jgi:hypothetical protein